MVFILIKQEKIKDFLKQNNVDAVLVCKDENYRYISGFTGSDSYLLLTEDVSYLITDSRYTEQAEAEAQAQAAQAQAQAESQAASRSSDRASISVPTAPASATGQALADYALQFQGYPYVAGGNTPSGWDCSGFVQWVFAQFGVSLPHYSGAQMSVGTAVGSIAEAAPGDIIVNTQHAAIYIGNGMVINALNPAQGTQVTSLAVFSGGYAIRRVL